MGQGGVWAPLDKLHPAQSWLPARLEHPRQEDPSGHITAALQKAPEKLLPTAYSPELCQV